MHIKYILVDLKSHWLHEGRLACMWIGRKEKEDRVGHIATQSLTGCCRPQCGY